MDPASSTAEDAFETPSIATPESCSEKRSVKVRFTITATRGGGDARMPQGVQLSEFLLWRAGALLCLFLHEI